MTNGLSQEYIPLFARVLRPKVFTLLLIGGAFYSVFSIHTAIIQNSQLGLLTSILGVVSLFPGALFLRSQANKLLIKNVNEVFSENSKTTKEIFNCEEDFKQFVAKAKHTIYNAKEILVILVVLPLVV